LLERTDDDVIEPGKLGFPGGKIEDGESNMIGALRELYEETGIAPKSIEFVKSIENEDGSISNYYECEYDGDIELSDEHKGYKWVEKDLIPGENILFGNNERYMSLVESYESELDAIKKLSDTITSKLSDGKDVEQDQARLDHLKETVAITKEIEELEKEKSDSADAAEKKKIEKEIKDKKDKKDKLKSKFKNGMELLKKASGKIGSAADDILE